MTGEVKSERAEKTVQAAFYGDDFTGSAENLAQFCRSGLKGRLFFETADADLIIREAAGLDVVGIAGASRSMSSAEMAAPLGRAFGILARLGARLVQYKVCSTFDSAPDVGNFAEVVRHALAAWPDAMIPVFPATPDFGRYTAFSNHFSRHQGAILRLDRNPALVDHPATPMRESDLRRHLQTLGVQKVEAVHLPELRETAAALAELVERRGRGSIPVVIDTVDNAQLRLVSEAIWRIAARGPVFALAAQGLAQGLGEVIAAETGSAMSCRASGSLAAVDRLLVLSGSCAVQSGRQLEACERAGWTMIEMPVADVVSKEAALGIADDLARRAIAALQFGRSVAAYTARGAATLPANPERTRHLGILMARVFRRAVIEAGVRRVAFSGGDSSSYGMLATGAHALDVARFDAEQSCHVFRLAARDDIDGIEVLLKGGQVGADDFFLRACEGTA